jgi:hypothetical protein
MCVRATTRRRDDATRGRESRDARATADADAASRTRDGDGAETPRGDRRRRNFERRRDANASD